MKYFVLYGDHGDLRCGCCGLRPTRAATIARTTSSRRWFVCTADDASHAIEQAYDYSGNEQIHGVWRGEEILLPAMDRALLDKVAAARVDSVEETEDNAPDRDAWGDWEPGRYIEEDAVNR